MRRVSRAVTRLNADTRHADTRLAIGRECQNPPDAAGLFILLKSICAEGLTRRHETECRHATRVRSSRFYMLLILRHISHNIYRISYRNILYHNTVQYSTVQYSTVQYSTVQYSTVQYDVKNVMEGREEGDQARFFTRIYRIYRTIKSLLDRDFYNILLSHT